MCEGPPLQTRASLAADLRRLGVCAGQVVMAHSSLRSIGYVLGGAQAVVGALLDVLAADGTLAMPAFSPEVSDPATWPATWPTIWNVRPLQDAALKVAQDHVPTFDPAITPTSMGAIAETFRNWPGVLRSAH